MDEPFIRNSVADYKAMTMRNPISDCKPYFIIQLIVCNCLAKENRSSLQQYPKTRNVENVRSFNDRVGI